MLDLFHDANLCPATLYGEKSDLKKKHPINKYGNGEFTISKQCIDDFPIKPPFIYLGKL